MEKSWEITLSDGTKLKNLRLSGNNYISNIKITENDFKGKLSKVIIKETAEDGQTITQEYEHMELVQIIHYDDGYYFVLRELSEAELKERKMQGDIEYLAMMTDIDLEEA